MTETEKANKEAINRLINTTVELRKELRQKIEAVHLYHNNFYTKHQIDELFDRAEKIIFEEIARLRKEIQSIPKTAEKKGLFSWLKRK